MRFCKCDHCGKQATPQRRDEEDYVEGWESVTVNTAFYYDICDECSPLLFAFFALKSEAKP